MADEASILPSQTNAIPIERLRGMPAECIYFFSLNKGGGISKKTKIRYISYLQLVELIE